jgi:hypothetical protein
MRHQTDWSLVWPVAAAALAFAIVYAVALAGGASVEEVLVRSSGALLIVGLASLGLRALLLAVLPDPDPPPGATIDITLPEADPNEMEHEA